MKILGIETSCDETAAAVVEGLSVSQMDSAAGLPSGVKVLSNVIASSVDLHAKTGGVVPEVAAREHIRQISPVIDHALSEAKTDWAEVDAIAVTHAPGLVSSLLVGVNTAQTLSYIHKKPLLPIHHIAGHIYANFLERKTEPEFPIIVLTVSGGHNELVLLKSHYEFQVIGQSLDDAAGEAFDKVARLLNLGFPGGPVIAKAAEKGNPNVFNFPRARLDKENRYNFSFSGLKTAVMQEVQRLTRDPVDSKTVQSKTDSPKLDPLTLADVAAGFQMAVVDVLADKLIRAAEEFDAKEVHLAGGVSANLLLRKIVAERLENQIPLHFPENLIYCTDNAAMIAAAAYFLHQKYPKRTGDFKRVEVFSQLDLS